RATPPSTPCVRAGAPCSAIYDITRPPTIRRTQLPFYHDMARARQSAMVRARMRAIALGLLGLGNVGAGVVKLLGDNTDAIESRLGARVAVRRILVREVDKPRLVEVDPALVTREVGDILDDEDIRIVVELMGGDQPAREYVVRAFEHGKHVVTA